MTETWQDVLAAPECPRCWGPLGEDGRCDICDHESPVGLFQDDENDYADQDDDPADERRPEWRLYADEDSEDAFLSDDPAWDQK